MSLLDQSGVTGGGLDLYNVHALFVNMDNMWTERFGNYDCLVYLMLLNFDSYDFEICCKINSASWFKVWTVYCPCPFVLQLRFSVHLIKN